MHDLNTITRLNNEAYASHADKERSAGRVVVLNYEGLTLVDHKSFDSVEDANDYAAGANALQGERREVLLPHTIPAHT